MFKKEEKVLLGVNKMNGFTLWKSEWLHIFKNKKMLVPMIAILFVPIMYAGMFLYAFWDPYEKLSDVPVAIVNLDKGSELEGKKIEVGNELVNELKKDGTFDFHFISKEEADKGMKNEKYYMEIVIPENTSANAATVLNEKPEQVELLYIPNEGYNFLSGQIGSTAVTTIQESVGNSLTKAYVSELLSVGSGLTEAADGATKISDGVTSANEGSTELEKNLKTIANKMITFEKGTSDAKAGASQLATGLKTLNTSYDQLLAGQQLLQDGSSSLLSGTTDLQKGIEKLYSGANQINDKVPALIKGTNDLNNGASNLATGVTTVQSSLQSLEAGSTKVSGGLTQLQQALNSTLTDQTLAALPPELKATLTALKSQVGQLAEGSKSVSSGLSQLTEKHTEIVKGADQLSAGTKTLADSSKTLAAGMKQLVDGQKTALDGSKELLAGQTKVSNGLDEMGSKMQEGKAGIQALAKGSVDLESGLVQINDGASQFSDASTKLHDGSKSLSTGLTKLEDGSTELSTKLTDSADKLKFDDTALANIEEMMSNPVTFKTEAMSAVPNYGTGFAPYFISLGLFVGALLTSIVFPLRESFGSPKRAGSWFISKFGVIAIVSFLQSLITSILIVTLLGLELESFFLYLVVGTITGISFMTLIQFFVTAFSDAGRFISIIILILQLTSSAGTFPIETVPKFIQAFNTYLPMTYSVSAYKAAISTGDVAAVWNNVAILGGFTVLFMVGTYAYMTIATKRRHAQSA